MQLVGISLNPFEVLTQGRDTACSTAFGSCAIPVFWGL